MAKKSKGAQSGEFKHAATTKHGRAERYKADKNYNPFASSKIEGGAFIVTDSNGDVTYRKDVGGDPSPNFQNSREELENLRHKEAIMTYRKELIRQSDAFIHDPIMYQLRKNLDFLTNDFMSDDIDGLNDSVLNGRGMLSGAINDRIPYIHRRYNSDFVKKILPMMEERFFSSDQWRQIVARDGGNDRPDYNSQTGVGSKKTRTEQLVEIAKYRLHGKAIQLGYKYADQQVIKLLINDGFSEQEASSVLNAIKDMYTEGHINKISEMTEKRLEKIEYNAYSKWNKGIDPFSVVHEDVSSEHKQDKKEIKELEGQISSDPEPYPEWAVREIKTIYEEFGKKLPEDLAMSGETVKIYGNKKAHKAYDAIKKIYDRNQKRKDPTHVNNIKRKIAHIKLKGESDEIISNLFEDIEKESETYSGVGYRPDYLKMLLKRAETSWDKDKRFWNKDEKEDPNAFEMHGFVGQTPLDSVLRLRIDEIETAIKDRLAELADMPVDQAIQPNLSWKNSTISPTTGLVTVGRDLHTNDIYGSAGIVSNDRQLLNSKDQLKSFISDLETYGITHFGGDLPGYWDIYPGSNLTLGTEALVPQLGLFHSMQRSLGNMSSFSWPDHKSLMPHFGSARYGTDEWNKIKAQARAMWNDLNRKEQTDEEKRRNIRTPRERLEEARKLAHRVRKYGSINFEEEQDANRFRRENAEADAEFNEREARLQEELRNRAASGEDTSSSTTQGEDGMPKQSPSPSPSPKASQSRSPSPKPSPSSSPRPASSPSPTVHGTKDKYGRIFLSKPITDSDRKGKGWGDLTLGEGYRIHDGQIYYRWKKGSNWYVPIHIGNRYAATEAKGNTYHIEDSYAKHPGQPNDSGIVCWYDPAENKVRKVNTDYNPYPAHGAYPISSEEATIAQESADANGFLHYIPTVYGSPEMKHFWGMDPESGEYVIYNAEAAIHPTDKRIPRRTFYLLLHELKERDKNPVELEEELASTVIEHLSKLGGITGSTGDSLSNFTDMLNGSMVNGSFRFNSSTPEMQTINSFLESLDWDKLSDMNFDFSAGLNKDLLSKRLDKGVIFDRVKQLGAAFRSLESLQEVAPTRGETPTEPEGYSLHGKKLDWYYLDNPKEGQSPFIHMPPGKALGTRWNDQKPRPISDQQRIKFLKLADEVGDKEAIKTFRPVKFEVEKKEHENLVTHAKAADELRNGGRGALEEMLSPDSLPKSGLERLKMVHPIMKEYGLKYEDFGVKPGDSKNLPAQFEALTPQQFSDVLKKVEADKGVNFIGDPRIMSQFIERKLSSSERINNFRSQEALDILDKGTEVPFSYEDWKTQALKNPSKRFDSIKKILNEEAMDPRTARKVRTQEEVEALIDEANKKYNEKRDSIGKQRLEEFKKSGFYQSLDESEREKLTEAFLGDEDNKESFDAYTARHKGYVNDKLDKSKAAMSDIGKHFVSKLQAAAPTAQDRAHPTEDMIKTAKAQEADYNAWLKYVEDLKLSSAQQAGLQRYLDKRRTNTSDKYRYLTADERANIKLNNLYDPLIREDFRTRKNEFSNRAMKKFIAKAAKNDPTFNQYQQFIANHEEAMRAFDKYWEKRTPEEQEEFMKHVIAANKTLNTDHSKKVAEATTPEEFVKAYKHLLVENERDAKHIKSIFADRKSPENAAYYERKNRDLGLRLAARAAADPNDTEIADERTWRDLIKGATPPEKDLPRPGMPNMNRQFARESANAQALLDAGATAPFVEALRRGDTLFRTSKDQPGKKLGELTQEDINSPEMQALAIEQQFKKKRMDAQTAHEISRKPKLAEANENDPAVIAEKAQAKIDKAVTRYKNAMKEADAYTSQGKKAPRSVAIELQQAANDIEAIKTQPLIEQYAANLVTNGKLPNDLQPAALKSKITSAVNNKIKDLFNPNGPRYVGFGEMPEGGYQFDPNTFGVMQSEGYVPIIQEKEVEAPKVEYKPEKESLLDRARGMAGNVIGRAKNKLTDTVAPYLESAKGKARSAYEGIKSAGRSIYDAGKDLYDQLPESDPELDENLFTDMRDTGRDIYEGTKRFGRSLGREAKHTIYPGMKQFGRDILDDMFYDDNESPTVDVSSNKFRPRPTVAPMPSHASRPYVNTTQPYSNPYDNDVLPLPTVTPRPRPRPYYGPEVAQYNETEPEQVATPSPTMTPRPIPSRSPQPTPQATPRASMFDPTSTGQDSTGTVFEDTDPDVRRRATTVDQSYRQGVARHAIPHSPTVSSDTPLQAERRQSTIYDPRYMTSQTVTQALKGTPPEHRKFAPAKKQQPSAPFQQGQIIGPELPTQGMIQNQLGRPTRNITSGTDAQGYSSPRLDVPKVQDRNIGASMAGSGQQQQQQQEVPKSGADAASGIEGWGSRIGSALFGESDKLGGVSPAVALGAAATGAASSMMSAKRPDLSLKRRDILETDSPIDRAAKKAYNDRTAGYGNVGKFITHASAGAQAALGAISTATPGVTGKVLTGALAAGAGMLPKAIKNMRKRQAKSAMYDVYNRADRDKQASKERTGIGGAANSAAEAVKRLRSLRGR